MKNFFKYFSVVVGSVFIGLLFYGSVSAAGTRVTNEGIQFPDGTVQKTKATETGTPGPQGEKGDKGDTGPQGDVGPQGPQGGIGPQGLKGDTGDTGPKGDTGAQGVKGDTGDTGTKGDTGETGAIGPQGPQGPQGEIGPTGADGFVSAISPVPKTGQTKCYGTGDPASEIPCGGTGQDGDLQRGFSSPSPRFTDNGDGTVTDNLTGLIWLKNANVPNAKRDWATALSDVVELNTAGTMNGNNAGDTSKGGSHQIDWRLPNVRELFSLIDFSQFNPALPNDHPFTGFPLYPSHWSNSNSTVSFGDAYSVLIQDGRVSANNKLDVSNYVWPVRGGQ